MVHASHGGIPRVVYTRLCLPGWVSLGWYTRVYASRVGIPRVLYTGVHRVVYTRVYSLPTMVGV